MKSKEIQTTISVLIAELGWSGFLPLLKTVIRKNLIFSNTSWSSNMGPEAQFVKRISIAPALYLELARKIGRDKAFNTVAELLIYIGCNDQWNHLNAIDSAKTNGMERLMAFNVLMDRKGAPRFNTREYIKLGENICHFQITRCVFDDFFTEAGTPELTKVFCEVDRRFFPEAFPDFSFHRGESWENTIAYGKDYCEFIFEMK
jgi:hypothetical protein